MQYDVVVVLRDTIYNFFLSIYLLLTLDMFE